MSARDILGCEECIVLEHLPHFQHGFDKDDRPVYYQHFGKCNADKLLETTTLEAYTKYHIWKTEKAVELTLRQTLKTGRIVETFTVVVDLEGMCMNQITPSFMSLVRAITAVDQQHYPERIGQLFIINPPTTFAAVFGGIKPWINERTRLNFNVVTGDFGPALMEAIDAEQLPVKYGGNYTDSKLTPVSTADIVCISPQAQVGISKTKQGSIVAVCVQDNNTHCDTDRRAGEDVWEVVGELRIDSSGVPIVASPEPSGNGGGSGADGVDLMLQDATIKVVTSPFRDLKRSKAGYLTQVFSFTPTVHEATPTTNDSVTTRSKWQCLLCDTKFHIFPLPSTDITAAAAEIVVPPKTLMVREQEGVSFNALNLVAVKCGKDSFTLYDSVEGNSLWTFACESEHDRDAWSQIINNVAKEAEDLALNAKNAKLRSLFSKYGV
jgi:hypothetical protein